MLTSKVLATVSAVCFLVQGCAIDRVEPLQGAWLGAGAVSNYYLGGWNSEDIGKVYRSADGERLLIGDLLWREKTSSEEDVRNAYAAWHVTRSTPEPLQLQGSAETLSTVLPIKDSRITWIRVEARGRKAEMLTDLMQLQALLGEPEFPDTRIEALKEQIRKDPNSTFEVCFLREWCNDLVIEVRLQRGASAQITRALQEALAKSITGPGRARERFVNYDETERVLRLEYTGPVLLRRRNVQIQVQKDGRVILGQIVTATD